MRKRLRKKLRRREFTEMGFSVAYRINPGLSSLASESLLDKFILEAIEDNDLHCGGGGGPEEWDFIVGANGRKSASEANRQAVRVWLKAQPDISVVSIGPLLDLWNGDEDAFEREAHGKHAA